MSIQFGRADQPINKFSEEWLEFMKLIKLLMHSGITPQAEEGATEGMPLATIGDVINQHNKLFNLAAEVYNIPREYLAKKMKEVE